MVCIRSYVSPGAGPYHTSLSVYVPHAWVFIYNALPQECSEAHIKLK